LPWRGGPGIVRGPATQIRTSDAVARDAPIPAATWTDHSHDRRTRHGGQDEA